MIKYAYKLNEKMKYGVLVSSDENSIKFNIPRGAKYWNLNNISPKEILDSNYTGIGVSELHLKVDLDNEEN